MVVVEANIQNANAQKMNKYEHFITDITTRDVSVHPFEIGSRGYISPSNKANLKKLHKFCKPSVSFKAMCENLSSLAKLSSYHIIRKRKTLDWNQKTPFLKTTSVAEFKEFERRLKFQPRLKHGWFHFKLYQMFQDLSRRLI